MKIRDIKGETRDYISGGDLDAGEELKVANEGRIREITDPKEGQKSIFELGVYVGASKLLYISPNNTSMKIISGEWGNDTKEWVDKTLVASKIPMSVRGQIQEVTLLLPKGYKVGGEAKKGRGKKEAEVINA